MTPTPDPDPSLADEAEWLAAESLLFADERSPFVASVTVGDPRLVVVVGENASGKSLFFRALCARAARRGATAVSVSIRERSGGGTQEIGRLRQVMMFGDESEQSTGATSVRAVVSAFANLDRPEGSILGLDEPELGLSDGYARALGAYIAERCDALPPACGGVVVVTHSRALVAAVAAGRPTVPTFVRAGAGAAGLDAWLAEPEVRTVDELLALPAVDLEQFRTTAALLRG